MIKHLSSVPPLTVIERVESIHALQEYRIDLVGVLVVGTVQQGDGRALHGARDKLFLN